MPALAQPLIDHREDIVRLCRAYGSSGSRCSARLPMGASIRSAAISISSSPSRPERRGRFRYFGLADALEQLLGRRVDLMTDQPIRNPYLRKAVDASRRDLYVRAAAEAS